MALPSEADKILTDTIIKAMKNINVVVVDHLIIGNGKYFSFAEHDLIHH